MKFWRAAVERLIRKEGSAGSAPLSERCASQIGCVVFCFSISTHLPLPRIVTSSQVQSCLSECWPHLQHCFRSSCMINPLLLSLSLHSEIHPSQSPARPCSHYDHYNVSAAVNLSLLSWHCQIELTKGERTDVWIDHDGLFPPPSDENTRLSLVVSGVQG